MKSIMRKLLALVLAYIALTLAASADLATETSPPPPEAYPVFAASHTVPNGNAGVTITLTVADGVYYAFAQDGAELGAYTGWMRSGPYRSFCANGVKQTGWQKIGNQGYFFNPDGVMRTGSVLTVPTGNHRAVFRFDENGVWDGNPSQFNARYAPKTLGDYLLDHAYPTEGDYEIRLWSENAWDFQKITSGPEQPGSFDKAGPGMESVLDILWKNANAELLYNGTSAGDVIVVNNDIYHGEDDIMIRLMGEDGHVSLPALFFSKDKAGDSYYYNQSYHFGVKLADPGAYDAVMELFPD